MQSATKDIFSIKGVKVNVVCTQVGIKRTQSAQPFFSARTYIVSIARLELPKVHTIYKSGCDKKKLQLRKKLSGREENGKSYTRHPLKYWFSNVQQLREMQLTISRSCSLQCESLLYTEHISTRIVLFFGKYFTRTRCQMPEFAQTRPAVYPDGGLQL